MLNVLRKVGEELQRFAAELVESSLLSARESWSLIGAAKLASLEGHGLLQTIGARDGCHGQHDALHGHGCQRVPDFVGGSIATVCHYETAL